MNRQRVRENRASLVFGVFPTCLSQLMPLLFVSSLYTPYQLVIGREQYRCNIGRFISVVDRYLSNVHEGDKV